MGEDTSKLSGCCGKLAAKPSRAEIKRVENGFIVEVYRNGRDEYIASTLEGALQIVKEIMA